ncbi:hypothetical protein [Variovorax sp. MHTC-1]|uniref:hypothetical protein n=1 Tax=Variovorax sp. MHTC-1 TaxID=2495593 RepID=UPI000F866B19|nr:hypothetical protein [Variovorax sp. MHTC-1]RST46721.1 hypothetical protein EJI01_28315 [Variovorax sp. MHTC-1]
MTAWVLLILTVACGMLTLDAFRMGAPLVELSSRFWPKEWKRGQGHLTLAEQERLQRLTLWSSLGAGWLAWVFLAMTLLLAILTARAFWL